MPLGGLGKPLQDVTVVIVDMDVDPSDTGALLYLLKHPGVSVRGVTVSCGITYVPWGVANVLRLLDYVGFRDIPVAAGKEAPLVGDNAFPSAWRGGSYNFYGLELPVTDLHPSVMNASELIVSVISSSVENITLVATGPLTNIALALQADPSIKDSIDVIHIMGGAVTVPGNVGFEYPPIPNFVAEWNIWVDPHAADIVFKSGVPITLIPLDATNEVPITEASLTKWEDEVRTREAEVAHYFVQFSLGLYFWDQLAAVALTNPSVVTFESHDIEVLIDDENQTGWTQSIAQDPPNTQVAVHADAELFENLFIETINYLEPPLVFPGPIILIILIGVGVPLLLAIIVLNRRRKPQSI
jgi:pyrimidine-specific ribonucleoside hydrolase